MLPRLSPAVGAALRTALDRAGYVGFGFVTLRRTDAEPTVVFEDLPVGELVTLLAFAHDRPTGELVAATLPALRELVRHGLLVPAP